MHKLIFLVGLGIASLTSISHAQFQSKATPVESISAKDGFKVELLYNVPKEKFGSWVNLCVDDKNRIIASDQFGGLYRFSAPVLGKNLQESNIELSVVRNPRKHVRLPSSPHNRRCITL